MAHSLSAKKRIRQNEKRKAINGMRRSRVKTLIKCVDAAIRSGDKDKARLAFLDAQKEMHRASINKRTKVFSLSRMSRILSRISAKVKAMA